MFPFDLFTSAASATNAADAPQISPVASIMQAVLPIIAVFYFFMLRPQQKRIREHEAMIKALKRGDKIVTGGGIVGTIHKLEGDDILMLEIAPDVKIRIMRDTISHVVVKTPSAETANDNQAEPAKSEGKK